VHGSPGTILFVDGLVLALLSAVSQSKQP